MPSSSLLRLQLIGIAANLVSLHAADDFPVIPEDFEVSLFARDPLVRNPCALTFDAKGRLCVGMGPQYRAPAPETPGDSVWIIIDEDNDGVADRRHRFATGLNSIQGLAWKGEWLWIANSPDLTKVRDTDNDGIADEYVRVYTDLGNLEHGLHGLNFGPDGRLYMSKGNSKGLTQLPDQLAPAPFRELWAVEVPSGTPEPKPYTFTDSNYQKNYQDPRDDWGVTGGILRCNDDGSGLEIFSRGFRNPWDISFDNRFDWLGTDNDQTGGDKIFAPFFGSHFGWGHSWSYDWKGDNHLPTAPSSGPLFEGSGTGVIFCNVTGYPKKYRNIFLINDWLNREVLIYQTKWEGAWRRPAHKKLPILAHASGGRSMPLSSGRAFDPVDIELGADGAIWISSWGRQYGAHYEDKKLANEGRIYRLWPKEFSPSTPNLKESTIDFLITQLGSHLPVWRTNAQEELIRLGKRAESKLHKALQQPNIRTAQETWLVWTLGRIDPNAWFEATQNQLIQSLRLAAFNRRQHPAVTQSLQHPEPRVRLAAVSAIHQLKIRDASILLPLVETETDRIVFYALWQAWKDLFSRKQLDELLKDPHPQIRLAALLALLELDELSHERIKGLLEDPHPPVSQLAAKRLGGKHEFEQRGRPLVATQEFDLSTPQILPFSDIYSSTGRPYRAATLEPGVFYYTDRNYRITKVPNELKGLTFLQTACSDGDTPDQLTVSLKLKYPSTVYFIDDARSEKLPAWARGKWQNTGLKIEGTDPKTMKVYQAELPAGILKLGPNRDGVRARKGHYLIAVRPKLLSPDGSLASTKTILPLLNKANLNRGRDLFFSPQGANCASCHQVHGKGNNHAPDLSNIGSRADAATLIESIINPSANIVEGFAAHQITTHDDQAHVGIILQETGRQVILAQTGGSTTAITKKEIKHRRTLDVSAMPEGFAAMLTSQQLADMTAWLVSLKKDQPLEPAQGTFHFQTEGSELQLFLDQEQIATYLLNHSKLTRRAFVNLKTPSGIQVTRNYPPRKPEDIDPGYKNEEGIIHPNMHPGLWMSFGWIEGNDYWRLSSKVKHEGFLEEPTGKKGEASFKSLDRYLAKNGKETICMQATRYHFQHLKEGILLYWDAEFYNDERDFNFGDQEESGLALRIASPFRVQGGNGRIINNRGEVNGTGTWGKTFKWINYSGNLKGKQVGIFVVPHPENPSQSWSHSRDYGVLVSNPFPKQPKERREPFVTTPVKKGDRFRLRYSILIHESDTSSFDPDDLAKRMVASGFTSN